MVTARFPPYRGGIETHVREVAPRLVDLGVDLEVLTTDPGRTLPRRDVVDGVKVRRIPAYPQHRDYYFAPGIFDRIRPGRYDLVHLQGYHNLVAPLTMLAARWSRTPYVVSLHSGGHSARLRRAMRGLQRVVLRPGFSSAAYIIAVSGFELELFRRSLRLPRSKLTLIRNGSWMPPPSTSPDPTTPLVLSVGRLERYKGHHHLIAAWPRVLARHPTARLRIVGTGPFEQHLVRQIGRLGLVDRVEIAAIPAGNPQAMSDALGQSSLVALLSEYESHPLAVMEALAVGRPVLVTESTGLRELVEAGFAHGVNPGADDDDVAHAVLALLDRPSSVEAPALFTWDDCAAAIHDVYRTVLE